MQAAICDEYIAVIDAKPYASDMECFVLLMEKFKETYGNYLKYPVAAAGYGSYNDYPYRVDKFRRDVAGNLICPNNKKFIFKYNKHVYKNKYGRTEEIYECEDCSECPYRSECCKKSAGNQT